MIAATTDYAGRTTDLEIFQTENPVLAFKQLSLTMTAGDLSRRVSGIQKLVQRYLLTFFTPKGSVPFNINFGSIFMTVANQGLLQSRTAVVQYFSFANMDIGQQLQQQDQLASTPPDEQFGNAYLMD